MIKLCPLIHRWAKRKKQWLDKEGKPHYCQRCRNCGALRQPSKVEWIKKNTPLLYGRVSDYLKALKKTDK